MPAHLPLLSVRYQDTLLVFERLNERKLLENKFHNTHQNQKYAKIIICGNLTLIMFYIKVNTYLLQFTKYTDYMKKIISSHVPSNFLRVVSVYMLTYHFQCSYTDLAFCLFS